MAERRPLQVRVDEATHAAVTAAAHAAGYDTRSDWLRAVVHRALTTPARADWADYPPGPEDT